MPTVGEVKTGKELGYRRNRKTRPSSWDYSKYIWMKCAKCGKERWVRSSKTKYQTFTNYCKECSDTTTDKVRRRPSGNKHPRWKGGRWKDTFGYVWVGLAPDSFFLPMADKRRRVKEHRLIMAQHLKRCLLPWEVIHHKNGIKDDNRLENLQLLPSNRWHLIDQEMKRYIRKLEQTIKELQTELTLKG